MTGPLYSPVDGAIIPDAWAGIPEPDTEVREVTETAPVSSNVPRWSTRYVCPACEGVGKWHMARCVVAPGQRRALLPPGQGPVVLLGPPRYPVIPAPDPEAIPL